MACSELILPSLCRPRLSTSVLSTWTCPVSWRGCSGGNLQLLWGFRLVCRSADGTMASDSPVIPSGSRVPAARHLVQGCNPQLCGCREGWCRPCVWSQWRALLPDFAFRAIILGDIKSPCGIRGVFVPQKSANAASHASFLECWLLNLCQLTAGAGEDGQARTEAAFLGVLALWKEYKWYRMSSGLCQECVEQCVRRSPPFLQEIPSVNS